MNNQYTDFYSQVEGKLRAHSCSVMNTHRDEALHLFATKGFPTRKVEEYRYTDVAHDFAPDFGIPLSLSPYKKTEFCCPISQSPIDLTAYYNVLAGRSQDPVAALCTLLASDGLLVYVPKGVRTPHPIQISHILKGEQDTLLSRRILIIIEEGAQAEVIITDKAAGTHHYLSNQVIEVFCQKGSRLHLYEIEETNLMCTRYSNVFIHEAANCSVQHTSITIHNGHSRNACRVQLTGEHAEVRLNGCVIADKMQHVDCNTLIEHLAPDCRSEELYKYVLDDSSYGAFAGKVYVAPGAQHTASSMTNSNLLATRSARMLTQPMLEIYSDDVKCSHGSTVGQLNDQSLFYMQQRGISLDEARLLLKSAFITEVIEAIPLPALRDRLHYLVDARMRGQLSKCEGCNVCITPETK